MSLKSPIIDLNDVNLLFIFFPAENIFLFYCYCKAGNLNGYSLTCLRPVAAFLLNWLWAFIKQ